MLKMFEPNKFPSEMAFSFLMTAITEAANSGTLVPTETIVIPIITVEKGWKGWLEDRRPASNGDPYKIAGRIVKTVKSANIS